MAYTNIDDPSAHFQVKTYTGTSGIHDVTLDGNSDMQPDFVWFKNRDVGYVHHLYDSSRGVTKALYSSGTNAEATITNGLTQFHTDGFRVTSAAAVNENSIVCWNWKANGGTTSSNTDGSITSTVQADTDAGFSIITYTGNATNSTVGHGLGVQPSVIINKKRGSTASWSVWHSALLGTQLLELNTTGATATVPAIWNSTVPTSSVFSIGTDGQTNSNNTTYVTYAFAEKQGYSKFGKYTGNGNADGTFVYTGFKPAFVLVKSSSATHNWHILDNKRDPENVVDKYVNPDNDVAEATFTFGDFLSNGFKWRSSSGTSFNENGTSYIYMAFAENPFVTSTGIPTTAR